MCRFTRRCRSLVASARFPDCGDCSARIRLRSAGALVGCRGRRYDQWSPGAAATAAAAPPRSIGDALVDYLSTQALQSWHKRERDEERKAHNVATKFFDEQTRGVRGAACGNDVIHDEYAGAPDPIACVGMDLEAIGAI